MTRVETIGRATPYRDAARAHFEAVGRDFLAYDPETGLFTYRSPPERHFISGLQHRAWLGKYKGTRAGGVNAGGYVLLAIQRWRCLAHHYAFFLSHRRWPEQQVDHINGDRRDNRIANLREVDASGNRMNQRRRSDNSSGVTGVIFDPRKNRWAAKITARGQAYNLGTFRSFSDAVRARSDAQANLGFGPNHGSH